MNISLLKMYFVQLTTQPKLYYNHNGELKCQCLNFFYTSFKLEKYFSYKHFAKIQYNKSIKIDNWWHLSCDQDCQWFATGWWFSLGTQISSTNKTEILIKVVLNTLTQTKPTSVISVYIYISIPETVVLRFGITNQGNFI